MRKHGLYKINQNSEKNPSSNSKVATDGELYVLQPKLKEGKLNPRFTANIMYCVMLKRATRSAHSKQFSPPFVFLFRFTSYRS
jgi:hypothetical protein